MARCTTTLDVPPPPRVAFDAIADLAWTAEWDDSIVAGERLDEGPIGLVSRFEVQLSLGRWHRGAVGVLFHPTEGGCPVVWRARFALRGPGMLLDPVLGVGLRRTATKSVEGPERFRTAEATDPGA